MIEWLTENIVEVFGAVAGMAYVILEIRRNILLWPLGILTSAVYIYVFGRNGFYAGMVLQGYYVVISVYGWFEWHRGPTVKKLPGGQSQGGDRLQGRRTELRAQGSESEVKSDVVKIDGRTALICLITSLGLWGLLWYSLDRWTDSPVPLWDGLITSLSVVATWMLTRKFIEQWYVWIVANAVAVIAYLAMGMYPTAVLFAVYFVMAIVGAREWHRSLPVGHELLQETAKEPIFPAGDKALKNMMTPSDHTLAPPATVILANGTFPTHAVPLAALHEAGLIVCCDGATEKLVAHGLEPGMIIGDLDSVSSELRRKYEKILIQDSDQETNDLTKAVRWCISQGIKEVVILGATGIREDHTLGNISLLTEYSRDIWAVMLTDTGSFRVFDKSAKIDSYPGQQVSLFSIDPDLAVTSTDLRYPLKNLKLNSWWRGTLNEAEGDCFTLEFEKGMIIVFLEY